MGCFHGVIVPLITPFRKDFRIDFEALNWLTKYLIDNGVHGIFPNSTTGEFIHLTFNESLKLTEKVLDYASSNVRILPGISANCTSDCINMGLKMKDLGVDGVIVTPPFFYKLNYDHLERHFSLIAEKIDLPIIIYNIPSTTGNPIPVSIYVKLISKYSHIVGAKITYDSLSYIRRLIFETKLIRSDFSVFTGLDEYLLPCLELGGDGGIMALANVIPRIHLTVYENFRSNNLRAALEEYKTLLKIVSIYDATSSFPTAIKTALKVLGSPVKVYVRPPLNPEPPEVEERVKLILKNAGFERM